MKNLFFKLFVLSVVLFVAFGCGLVQRIQKSTTGNSANSSYTDTARETLGFKKTGVAECDEAIDILIKKSKENADAEDSWQRKAIEEVVKQQIYDYLNKDNANKSPKEKAEMAKNCKYALEYLKDEPKK